ncbi:hypothetical protein Pyn_19596 [Prunus yedoensis var. nudiflora]|uniref:Uncharacterized protein n=1 Tax=Prunus yedoensis var. nudiflora TaxID=2094558 RepID=A0A315AJ36_PRUYE|nr:hypothetical protein Pyn_19596 [Prunus yedoensis var. nudiflora]
MDMIYSQLSDLASLENPDTSRFRTPALRPGELLFQMRRSYWRPAARKGGRGGGFSRRPGTRFIGV